MPEPPKMVGSNPRVRTLEFSDLAEHIEHRVGEQIGRRLIIAE